MSAMSQGTRILIVDDERSVREMTSILLKRHGYDVVTAGSAAKAVAMLTPNGGFDLVISDLLMDHGTGIRTAR